MGISRASTPDTDNSPDTPLELIRRAAPCREKEAALMLPNLLSAHHYVADLQRQAKSERLTRVSYPDRERTPRILSHWANRG